MKAVTFHAKRDVRVDTVPDPTIEQPTDAIVRITSAGICGSDLHLYEVMGPYMDEGDILGHEPMGIVEEVGADVTQIALGDQADLLRVPQAQFGPITVPGDPPDERFGVARRNGVHAVDLRQHDDIAEALRELTDGRGPDSVIDAVGMEAHGAPMGKLAHQVAGLLHAAIDSVRRGGTISLSGVYGGMVDPMPMMLAP